VLRTLSREKKRNHGSQRVAPVRPPSTTKVWPVM
jgi:hypothetical protein